MVQYRGITSNIETSTITVPVAPLDYPNGQSSVLLLVSILYLVSSPDCHVLWLKDGLEQLLQILGPSVKHPFHLNGTLVNNRCPF